MLPCNDCRPLILDHLYGLLDATEAATVEAHLASCPACAAARDEAARMQGLIAKAAKGAFPAVRFEAPVAKPSKPVTPAAARPATAQQAVLTPSGTADSRGAGIAAGRRSMRVGVWLPWAVAAAVLIAIPGTVVPVMGVLNRAETAKRDADAQTAKVTAALSDIEQVKQDAAETQQKYDRDLAAAVQPLTSILDTWTKAEKDVLEARSENSLGVRKAATLQPGAPNEFMLVLRNRGTLPNGNMIAEVRDQTDAVIYSQPIDERVVEHTIRLPARVWTNLKPQSELFLSVASVDNKSQKRTELQERIRLFGPVFTTVLTTDKPQYRPGETVFFRSLTLDRVSFTPPQREQVFRYELRGPHNHPVRAGVVSGGTELARMTDGKLETVLGPDSKPLRGVGTGSVLIPAEAPDGDYSLTLHELPHPAGYPASVPYQVKREFKVQSGAIETYRKEITYSDNRASYVAGNTVNAVAKLMNLSDRAVPDARVQAVVTVDDHPINVVAPLTTGKDGQVPLQFTLPPDLERGDVRLRVTFQTSNGREEFVAERVPVVGRHVTVEFFPEGGYLVAGAPCRVYFRATTPAGHPVDISGVITDGRKVLAEVKTLNDAEKGVNRGIGSFEFTPELGTPVWLKLSNPTNTYEPLLVPDRRQFAVAPAAAAGSAAVIGTRTGFLLPEPLTRGVVMKVLNPVTAPGDPIRVHLRSVARTRNLVVGAYTRGQLSDTRKVTVPSGEVVEVPLMGNTDPRGGVVRITVFEEPREVTGEPAGDLMPVAERLVFRKPGELLNLDLALTGTAGDERGFMPGSAVDLGITATADKAKQKPAAAVLYAAVVNNAVAPGPKDHLLTTHFLIAGEVSTPDAMEYADFLLSDDPMATTTLDLVLATQGWRRFAEQTPEGYVKDPVVPSAEHVNLMVCNGQYTMWSEAPSAKEHRRLYETYWPAYEKAVKKFDAVRAQVEAAKADRPQEKRLRELASQAENARDEALASERRVEEATAPVARLLGAGWYAVAGFALLALLLGVASFTRSTDRLPLGIGTVGSLGLVAFLVFALGMADRTHAAVETGEADSLPPQAKVAEQIEIAPRPADMAPARSGEATTFTQAADVKTTEDPGRPGRSESKAKADRAGNATEAFPTSVLPPKMPRPPNTSGSGSYPPNAVIPSPGDGRGGFGGEFPPRGVPAPPKPVSGPHELSKIPDWIVRPWVPAFPDFQSNTPPIRPGAAKGPGGFSAPKYGGYPKFPFDGGWQPKAKIIPDRELNEGPFREWIGLQTKKDHGLAPSVHPAMLAPAPSGGGVGGGTPGVAGGAGTAPPGGLGGGFAPKHDANGSKTLTQDDIRVLLAQARRNMDTFAAPVEKRLAEELSKLQSRDRATSGDQTVGRVQQMRYGGMTADVLALYRIQSAVPRVTPLVVREYAAPRPGSNKSAGSIASDTILWQPVIVLPSDGKATLTFQVGNAEGGYDVIVAGHTLDGRIGAARTVVPVAHTPPTSPLTPAGQPTSPTPIPPPAPPVPDKR